MAKGTKNKGLSLYIHWPFCASKCPYCDFNSHVADTVDQDRWREALLAELKYFANETSGLRLSSIFFGGGTPSLMPPATVAALINAATDHWTPQFDLEVTLEANPSTAEADRFQAFRDAGVNRLSLGVQSLQDQNLLFLGRGHSADEARSAIELAEKTFPRFTFDMIYGLPDQTADDWNLDLDQALALAGNHLSVYQLSIDPGTAFHRDGVMPADEDTGFELFEICQRRLAGAGLPAYEISNHARPGFESRHNMEIWRGGDYVGIGPGAHGHISGPDGTDSLYQIHAPERWLAAVDRKGHGTAKRQTLSQRERTEEVLMTGLRLTEGIPLRRFRARTGAELETRIDLGGLKRMVDGGFMVSGDDGVRVTAAGRLCLNEVLRQLLVG